MPERLSVTVRLALGEDRHGQETEPRLEAARPCRGRESVVEVFRGAEQCFEGRDARVGSTGVMRADKRHGRSMNGDDFEDY